MHPELSDKGEEPNQVGDRTEEGPESRLLEDENLGCSRQLSNHQNMEDKDQVETIMTMQQWVARCI
jgi:hypothetical protein